MAWTTPPTWVSLELVTAADLNTYLSDNLTALAPGGTDWQDWTPTTANLTLGSGGAIVARYLQIAEIVDFEIEATMGTGLSVGDVTFTVPVAEAAYYNAGSDDRWTVGKATLINAGSAVYSGDVSIDDGVIRARALNASGTYALQTNLSSTVPFTWAANDRLVLQGRYEAA